MDKMLINCDWLQFWCLRHSFMPAELTRDTNFKVTDQHKGTRVFAKTYSVVEKSSTTKSHHDEEFAVLAMDPYSDIIDRKMVLVKIANRALYQPRLYSRIVWMLKKFNFEYQGITRFDICCDFHTFAGGLHPLTLLERYRGNKFVKYGCKKYSEWLTAPFTASTLPFGRYADGGEQGQVDRWQEKHCPHCVTWGAEHSDVHVKLYNKTKEIREESKKLYIKRWWTANGLEGDDDVWRCEISVGGRSRTLKDLATQDKFNVSLLEACNTRYQVAAFMAFADRYFSFRDTEGCVNRKQIKEVVLFDIVPEVEFRCAQPNVKADPSRTAKVCAKYLANLPLQFDIDAVAVHPIAALNTCRDAIALLEEVHHELKSVKKDIEYKYSDYAEQLAKDFDMLRSFGVVVEKGWSERREDLEEMILTEDARRRMIEGLEAYYINVCLGTGEDNLVNYI